MLQLGICSGHDVDNILREEEQYFSWSRNFILDGSTPGLYSCHFWYIGYFWFWLGECLKTKLKALPWPILFDRPAYKHLCVRKSWSTNLHKRYTWHGVAHCADLMIDDQGWLQAQCDFVHWPCKNIYCNWTFLYRPSVIGMLDKILIHECVLDT